MTADGGARAEILHKIRAARRAGYGEESGTARATAAVEWLSIPRKYRRLPSRSRNEILDLLQDRLRDYDAHVVRSSPQEAAQVVRQLLTHRNASRMLVPEALPDSLLSADLDIVVDRGMSLRDLDSFDGVLTGATVAIAETGTLVLQHGPGQGRRAATLVPDYHLCVVRQQDVVETVPEAMDILAGTAALPTTFVSGPSATADIEMTRIKGVHGPRFLDVLLLI